MARCLETQYPLNRQGITERSLQRGDRVILTGNPHKTYKDVMMLTSITRPSDGWKWSDSKTASDAALTPTPKTSGGPESKVPASQAAGGSGDRAGALNNDPRLATLEPKVRQMVLEEAAAAKVLCDTNMTLMNFYECDCYAGGTLNRRLKAGTETDRNSRDRVERFTKRSETLMLEWDGMPECVSTPKIEKYGREQAAGLQLHPSSTVSECAGRELAVRFKKQPRAYVNNINALLVQAMQSCKSSAPPGTPTTLSSTPAAPPQTAVNPPSSSAPKASAQPQSTASASSTVSAAGANSTSDVQRRQALSGRWEFVNRSGEVSDPYTVGHRSDTAMLTITQDGDMLTLGRTPQELATSYRVDGVERPSSWRNSPADPVTTGTTMAAWNGDRVVVEIRLKYPDNLRTVSARRVFSFTADGGLVIETTGAVHLKNGPSQNLNGSTLYRRSTSDTQGAKASPVSPRPGNLPTPVTPKAAGTPAAAQKVTPPPPADTLGDRQAQIDKEVAAGTKSVTDELRLKSQAALEHARKESSCTQRAIKVNADQTSPAYRTAFDTCMAEDGSKPAGPGAGQQAAPPALGAPWRPCTEQLRSLESRTAVPIEFFNASSQPRKLYWMDFGGTRQLYGTLQPGQCAPMQTYVTHSWMAADSADRCLGTIVISKAGRVEIR